MAVSRSGWARPAGYEAATALHIDPDHLAYIPLAELATATEKARRDAPAIAVCELA